MAIFGLRGLAFDNGTYLEFIVGNFRWNPGTSARGFRDGAVNVFPCSLVRPSRRISQMHKEFVSCIRRWHGGDVQIDGLLPTGDCYSCSPTGFRFQQVDLHHLHPLSKKRCFWNALGYTLVVLEVL